MLGDFYRPTLRYIREDSTVLNHRCENVKSNNIKMILKKMGVRLWSGLDWLRVQWDDLTCEMCLKEDESATHILCDCGAIAHLRFRHLGQFFMEPSDYYGAPINKVLHFIRGVRLIRG
jgi:hypothetical protein